MAQREMLLNVNEIRLIVFDEGYLQTDRPVQYMLISCTSFEESKM
jgi:hypothetical protein